MALFHAAKLAATLRAAQQTIMAASYGQSGPKRVKLRRCAFCSAFLVWLRPFDLAAFAAAGLPRIVSLNLCADPYLMAFADKTQIAALTHLSRDPDMSAYAEAAQAFSESVTGRLKVID